MECFFFLLFFAPRILSFFSCEHETAEAMIIFPKMMVMRKVGE